MMRKSIHDADSSVNSTSKSIKPIAESTHIEHSVIGAATTAAGRSASSPSKFAWGGRYNLQKKKTNLSSTATSSKPMFRSNSLGHSIINKVDPQVYTDTQSKGLASRIVMYYEKSNTPKKPISNRLYNRPGQFPIVHLDKAQMTMINPRRSVTNASVQIPAPDRSNFQLNSRSEILRTGSILTDSSVPNDEHVDGGDQLAPLDALKEISRKRIHCDKDIDSDQVKKQKAERDTTDSIGINGAGVVTGNNNVALSKRQRDKNSPNSKGSSVEAQKKRLCTKNNDILSSLSSSLLMVTPKRKIDPPTRTLSLGQLQEQQKPNLDASQLKYHKSEAGISQLPTTTQACSRKSSITETVVELSKQNVTTTEKSSAAPKLTLFNKNYNTSTEKLNFNQPIMSDDENNSDEDANIAYVKPKKSSPLSANAGKELFLKPVEKSKLSLMLSYLSGDINDDEDGGTDVVDTKSVAKVNVSSESLLNVTNTVIDTNKSITTTVASGVLTAPSSNVKNSIGDANKIVELSFEKEASTATVSLATATTTVSESKLSEPIAASPIVKTFTSPVVTTSTSSSERIGGFSYTASTATSKIEINQPKTTNSTTELNKSSGFKFGGNTNAPLPSFIANTNPEPATTKASVENVSSDKVSDKPVAAFAFGNSQTSQSATSFGLNKPASTTISAPITIASTTTNLTFGATATISKSNITSVDKLPTFGISSTAAPSFGNISSPFATSSAAAASTANPVTAFGSSSKSQPESSNKPPTFGSSITTASFGSTTTANTLSFGNTNAASTFAGGSTTNAPVVFGATSPPSFGSSTGNTSITFGNTKSSNTASSFGVTNAPVFGGASAVPTFGSSTTTAPPSFGSSKTAAPPTFGNSTINPAPTFGSSSTNVSAAFGSSTTAPPSFGSSTTTAPPSFGSTANAPPSFGRSTITSPPAFGSTTNGPPAFGSSTNNSPFGSSATNKSNTFGNSNQSKQLGGMFGGSSNQPLNFAKTEKTNTFENQTKPIVFGQATTANTTSPFAASKSTMASPLSETTNNLFGGSTIKPSASAGPFAFGSNNTAVTQQQSAPSASSPFGAAASTTAKSTATPFAFGGNTSSPSSNLFGATQTPTPSFNFANNQPTTTASSMPIFGGSQSNADNKSSTFAFSSNSAQTTSASPFGGGNSNSAFGGSPATGGSGGTFTFGGAGSSSSASSDASKVFSFSQMPGSQPPQQSSASSSMFGGGGGGPAASTPASTPFSFGASPATPSIDHSNAFSFSAASPQQQPPANLFNASPMNGSSVKRPIRQAVRRINK